MSTKNETIVIPDMYVEHIWESPEDHEGEKEIAVVSPDWYENNGTPITCEGVDGVDMEYKETRINKDYLLKLVEEML